MKNYLSLCFALLSSSVFATDLPENVINLSRPGSRRAHALAEDAPTCPILEPIRQAKADLQLMSITTTKEGNRYRRDIKGVCRLKGQINVYEFGKEGGCIRSEPLQCEVDENGVRRKLSVYALVFNRNESFLNDLPASDTKNFVADFYVDNMNGDPSENKPQGGIRSAFGTLDMSLATGLISLVPEIGGCRLDKASGEVICDTRPVAYMGNLMIEDKQ